MMALTHMAAGALIGEALCKTGAARTTGEAAAIVGSAVLGSLLPDIDSVSSKLGRKFLAVSAPIQLFIGHRTMFHAPLFYCALAVVGIAFSQTGSIQSILILTAALGALSHILLDSFNPGGVPFFWPYPRKYHLATFRVRGPMDLLLFLVIAIGCFLLLGPSIQSQVQFWRSLVEAVRESWSFSS